MAGAAAVPRSVSRWQKGQRAHPYPRLVLRVSGEKSRDRQREELVTRHRKLAPEALGTERDGDGGE